MDPQTNYLATLEQYMPGYTPPSMPGMGGGQGMQLYNTGTTNPLAIAQPTMTGIAPPPGSQGGPGNWWDGAVGTKEAPGWGGMALGAAGGLMNAFMAMKQYGIAKDTLAANKEQFRLNYDAQKTTTNSALEDRQRARVASNPGAYQSVGSYMDRNGIRG